MPQKYRAQILLEPSQHRALSEIAAERNSSISNVVREVLADYLAARDLDEQQRVEILALEALADLRRAIRSAHGTLPENLLTTLRDERAEDLDDPEGASA